MPTYPYACTECGHRFEAVQAFSDDSLTVCPVCSGRLRKVFSSVGIVFKGSGFYRNDSRGGAVPKGESSSDKGGSDKGASEKSGSEKSTESKGSDSSSPTGTAPSTGGDKPAEKTDSAARKPASTPSSGS